MPGVVRCTECGQDFASEEHLKRHLKVHDPEIFKCPYEGCDSSSFHLVNVRRHINAIHTRAKEYHCRIDLTCLCPFYHPSAGRCHEVKAHECRHSMKGGARTRSSYQPVRNHETSAVQENEDDADKNNRTDRSISSSKAATEDAAAEDGKANAEELIRDSTTVSPSSNLLYLQGSPRLSDFRPMSPRSAERPTLPGVQDILSQCRDIKACSRASSCAVPSRTLPLVVEPSVPLGSNISQDRTIDLLYR